MGQVPGEQRKTITVRLDPETWLRLKLSLTKQGSTIQQAWERFVEQELNGDGK